MVEFGRKRGNIRSMVWGYQFIGDAHLLNGDVPTALEWFERQTREAQDPLYYHAAQTMLGIAYALNGQFRQAEPPLEKVLEFSRACRWEWIGMFAKIFLSAVWIAEGRMSQGLQLIESCRQTCWENGRKFLYAMSEYLIGNVYLQISMGEGELGLSSAIKNVGFLVKSVPFAGSKAERHFNEAIKVADEIGAKWLLGLAYLDLGRFHKAKNRQHEAGECLSKAVDYFDRCEAEIYLKQAREELESLS
jgi:tetratricopeptide (TPR) repeat protein